MAVKGDLDGIFVVSLEQAVAAPYAACQLADAGARVVKIERPEGDFARNYDSLVHGGSAYFIWLNRGKEAICLDLRTEADREVFAAMLAKADVFIQNLVPGAVERLGFGIAKLREMYPRLITCSISGYGAEGPYRDQKAYDLLIQAETGLSAINGIGDEPARVGVSVCDIAAGMTAHRAILQALFARERTGEGRAIDISLFHATADWMNVPYLQHRYGDKAPKRQGLKHPTIAPYGVFRCADGKGILISIQNEREWVRLVAALGLEGLSADPDFASNDLRVANRPALEEKLATGFAAHDREAIIAKLAEAKIAYGRESSLEDLRHHPQARFLRVETEGGPVELLSPEPALRLADAPGVPQPDQNGDALRREFGTPS